MPKVRRSALVGEVTRFTPDDGPLFLIDNVKIGFSPNTDALREHFVRAPLAIDLTTLADTFQLGLGFSVALNVRRSRRGAEICWRAEHGQFQQSLGVHGRRRNVTLVGDWNPIRAVRGSIPAREQRLHLPQPDNYLDPRIVPKKAAQEACLRAFKDWVAARRLDYCAVLAAIWGERVTPEQVHVSVNMIELAWDVLAPHAASLAARLFGREWNRLVPGAKATFVAEHLEHESDGCLRGVGEHNGHVKLYRKTEDILRFEAQLTRKSALRLLKKATETRGKTAFTPADIEQFVADLGAVASAIYPLILDVQAGVVSPTPASLPALLSAMAHNDDEREILHALFESGKVKCGGQNARRRLRRLRHLDLVAMGPGKGWWSATPALGEIMSVCRRVSEAQAEWYAS